MKLFLKDLLEKPRSVLDRIRSLVPRSAGEIVGLALAAAAAAGAVMAFHGLTVWLETHVLGRLEAMGPKWFVPGSLACVLVGTGLASLLILKLAPSAAGGGVLPVKLAFWRDFGVMRKREAAVKLVASALTLGSGVSLGPEGPSIQIGAATMASAAGAGGVAKQARRAWCAAGAAAGLAAVFNAPLAAITFILEEVIGDLNSRLLGKVVMAAVIGALIGHACLGPQPAFQVAPVGVIGWRAWILVPFVALGAALAGSAFQKAAMQLRGRLPRHAFLPVLGGVGSWVFGTVAYLLTRHAGIFGVGYGDISETIAGRVDPLPALLLCLGKILATAIAVGTGSCGGIFAPSLFIGAMAGSALAGAAAHVMRLTNGELSMLAMVGMAASLGAVIRTPLTCVLLLFEVTNEWVIVPALMLAAIVSQAVAHATSERDMYEDILVQDGVDPNQVLPPRHFKRWREMPVSTLASFKPIVVRSLAPADLTILLGSSGHQCYPVVDAKGRVTGLLPRREAELAATGQGTPRLDTATWVDTRAKVGDARKLMIEQGVDFVCVGDAAKGEIQGILTLHDLLRGESVLEDDASV